MRRIRFCRVLRWMNSASAVGWMAKWLSSSVRSVSSRWVWRRASYSSSGAMLRRAMSASAPRSGPAAAGTAR